MRREIRGLHHITGITADVKKNKEFYTDVLGLRFLKKTINQDDPGTYHLYYGDYEGSAGHIMTFFGYEGSRRGRKGTGQTTRVTYYIPLNSADYWKKRLKEKNVSIDETNKDRVIFQDPDGLELELLEKELSLKGWAEIVPEKYAITKFGGVTINSENPEETKKMLENIFGFKKINDEEYETEQKEIIRVTKTGSPGSIGAGSIHHVAWTTDNPETQLKDRETLQENNVQVTEVVERMYFKSIYFREPGHSLFEIATNGPGFTIDEPVETLGEKLVLPPWYEHLRERIEKHLPELS